VLNDDAIILPMLALKYIDRGHDIVFPCFVQPKLDGVRCIYRPNGTMMSRKGKSFPNLNHIVDELKGVDAILDGELYSDTLAFEELVGAVRRENIDEKKLIHFVVFDVVDEKASFAERLEVLKDLKKTLFSSKYIRIIETSECKTEDNVYPYLEKFESQGYEGLILRNKLGEYKQKHRSKNLQKLKTFQDAEYPIVGCAEGQGLEKGCVVWVCMTETGHEFRVRPIGTREDRMEYFKNGEKYLNSILTVKFQELTADGIPRFPVGITIRNYE
jgi:ATP-dependent DNA ligase